MFFGFVGTSHEPLQVWAAHPTKEHILRGTASVLPATPRQGARGGCSRSNLFGRCEGEGGIGLLNHFEPSGKDTLR